jgi:hypothetical protein
VRDSFYLNFNLKIKMLLPSLYLRESEGGKAPAQLLSLSLTRFASDPLLKERDSPAYPLRGRASILILILK